MGLRDDINASVDDLFATAWNVRDGNTVPTTDTVVLKDGAVKVVAAFLYADLAGSSKIAAACPWQTTAKIIRAYLNGAVRLIKYNGGEVRSFDGDRVMGVFMGATPCNSAVRAARNIDDFVTYILNPKSEAQFASIKNNGIRIRHCVGVSYGEARAVRAGIRGSNDLIWIGESPSISAKLSDVRNAPYEVWITSEVLSRLNADLKVGIDGKSVWVQDTFSFAGNNRQVYKTSTTLDF